MFYVFADHSLVQEALLERLSGMEQHLGSGIAEKILREALHYANVKLMGAGITGNAALIIAHKEKDVLLAGMGKWQVFSSDGELLFSDPLAEKNCLGGLKEPEFHVRALKRSELPSLSIRDEKGEVVKSLSFGKAESIMSKRPAFIRLSIVTLLASFLAFFFYTWPHPLLRDPEIHVVGEGESLAGIAETHYGTAKRWNEIYLANQELLSSEPRIKPGMQLIIP